MILGLTGGLGCGKSTAARFFEQQGFRLLDSDAIVRDHILTSADVKDTLCRRFGPGAVTPAGLVDRAFIGSIVFSQESERIWLEELTHPLVFAYWRERLREAPDASWVVETPLLFEKQLENWFDFITCVDCSPQQQLSRLEQRGLSRAHAARRISAQLPLARKIDMSDFVLLNDGTPGFLQDEIDLLVSAFPIARR